MGKILNLVKRKSISIDMQLGIRMALLIIAVSLCISGASLLAGSSRYSQMQIAANKEIGYELGRIIEILTEKDDVIESINKVKEIYESAPQELRDAAADQDAEYLYSTEGGAYEELFAPVKTEAFSKSIKELDKVAKDLGLIDVNIFFLDPGRERNVYVMCGVGAKENYDQYYSAPGSWIEVFDFALEYEKSPDIEPGGLHSAYKGINGEYIMESTVPFYDPDTGEVIAYVSVERSWENLDEERYRFLAGFMLIIGAVTLVLVALSEVVLNFAIMRPLSRLTEEKTRMSAELDVASHIQLSMLPDKQNGVCGSGEYAITADLYTAKEVGGDFYDYFVIDDDHIAIVIADAVGKGVPAALFSVVAKTMLFMCAQNKKFPGNICAEVNDYLCKNNEDVMFVTVWFGIYTISEKRLCYVNAGHENAAVYRNGRWEYDDEAETGFALGIMPGMPYSENTLQFAPGEKLFLFTDGIKEAQREGDGEELYGSERLLACLNANKERLGAALLEAVYRDTCDYVGDSPQFDDITMILFEIK